MSILGKIFGKLLGTTAEAAPVTQAPVVPSTTQSPAAAADSGPASIPASDVDIAAILDKAVASKGQKLHWKTSIVDLMKALDLDSSLQARQELARELNYKGDFNDSPRMNVWLHAQVMKALAENGGKVPAELQD